MYIFIYVSYRERSGGKLKAAEEAEKLLREMTLPDTNNNNSNNNNRLPPPNLRSVHHVINTWIAAGVKNRIDRAEAILGIVDDWNSVVTDPQFIIQPTVDTYNILIEAHARNKYDKNAARKAEAILYRLIQVGAPDQNRSRPNTRSFVLAIQLWARSKERMAAERAEQLLEINEKMFANGNSAAQPNVVTYTQVIDAWAKSRRPDAGQRASKIFQRMNVERRSKTCPNTITVNALLNAWANSNDPTAPNEASKILTWMKDLHRQGYRDLKPNGRTIGAVMACYAKQSNTDETLASKAEDLLTECIDTYVRDRRDRTMQPNSFLFLNALNAWIWSGSPGTSDGVQRILRLMEDLFVNKKVHSPPNSICYNAAIRFYLDDGNTKAATTVLAKMEALFVRYKIKEAAPDKLTYGAVLNAVAAQDPNDAITIFQQQLSQVTNGNQAARPNTFCYCIIITAMTKAQLPGCDEKALSILEDMKRRYQDGDTDAKPDVVTYTAVISALAKSSQPDNAAKTAIRLLTEMKPSGGSGLRPNLPCFNAVLYVLAQAKSLEAANRAEELLRRMERLSQTDSDFADVRPDVRSYTILLGMWASLKTPEAATRAADILRTAERIGEARQSLVLDVVAYNKVILGWANVGEAEKAEQVLLQMLLAKGEKKESEKKEKSDGGGGSRGERGGAPPILPDSFSYKTVLLAWSQAIGGASRANHWLEQMEEAYRAGRIPTGPDALCLKAVASALDRDGE